MFVYYRPEDGEERQWEWIPEKVRAGEAEAIEKRLGDPWPQLQALVAQGSVRARRILLWHLQKREHPTLKLDDVDFAVGELECQFSRSELEKIRGQVADAKHMSEADRAEALRVLDAEIESAPAGDGEGKARSKKSA